MSFYSDGLRLVGDLYLPSTAPPGGAPGVVFCGGWGGGKRVRAGIFAAALAERGFGSLAFEYRGWGDEGRKSEGDNDRLFPSEHTADARAAIAYLGQRPEIDARRLAMMGMFNGAAITLQAASEDSAIKAAIGLFPFGDGGRWMRALRRYYEWEQFLERLDADRRERATTGKTTMVDPNEILIRDEVAYVRHEKNRDQFPERAAWRLGLDSADAIVAFRPVDHVHRIAGRPVLLIAAERDTLLPIEEVRALYGQLHEPKRLIELTGVTHDGTFEEHRQAWLIEEVADFLTGALGVD